MSVTRDSCTEQMNKRLSSNETIPVKPQNLPRGRKSISLGKGERFQSERIHELQEERTELVGSDAELLIKLQLSNFEALSRIKSTRGEYDYRELMKDIINPSNTNEKVMEMTIDKDLIPVLVEMLKYYRKMKVLK